MARIDWAVPCRYVEVQPTGATIVGAGMDALVVAATPAEVRFMVAVRLVVPEHEFGEEHEFQTRLLGPDLNAVGSPTRVTFQANAQPQHEPGTDGTQILASDVRFSAAEPGRYTLEMVLDGRTEQTVAMRVVVPQPPGSPRP
jgi:hypothetical protein